MQIKIMSYHFFPLGKVAKYSKDNKYPMLVRGSEKRELIDAAGGGHRPAEDRVPARAQPPTGSPAAPPPTACTRGEQPRARADPATRPHVKSTWRVVYIHDRAHRNTSSAGVHGDCLLTWGEFRPLLLKASYRRLQPGFLSAFRNTGHVPVHAHREKPREGRGRHGVAGLQAKLHTGSKCHLNEPVPLL